MYNRVIKSQIISEFYQGKVVVVVGPRQVGKTTLFQQILEEIKNSGDWISFNCDNPTDREKLSNKDFEYLKNLIGGRKIVFVDEAQKVETIGQTIKLLVDGFKKEKQIIATGSSSINLLDKTSEPLTGRKMVFRLYPLSVEELYPDKNLLAVLKELESLMIYGSYPEVRTISGKDKKEKLLEELASSYLFKDILEFQAVKNSSVLFSLLKALSLQIGSEVSYNELSNIIGIEKRTVERYVDLLEKNYIVFRLPPFAANKRRTISKLRKIYFYDLGIRNAVINNFNDFSSRADVGAIWENFALMERLKRQEYHGVRVNNYFLRTYDGAEIDLIEESGGETQNYEFKWKKPKKKHQGVAAGMDYKIISPDDLSGFFY